jgi:hypothetical protein
LFTTERYADRHVTDNACVMQRHVEEKTNTIERAYGRIMEMYEHRMHPGDDSPTRVIIECKWYELVGTDPVNHLPVVKYNPNWDESRHVFLDTCIPASCRFWPQNPFVEPTDDMFYNVIQHHE